MSGAGTIWAMETGLAELTKVLEQLQRSGSFQAAAEHLTRWAREFTSCQAAVLRLLAEDGSPWLATCALDGPSTDFVRDEVLLHTGECICGRVATGAVDPALPFFTEGGSFLWDRLGTITEHFTAEELGNLRGRCLEEGYESLAVVPVKAAGKPMGSLHLADHRPSVFDSRIAVVEAVCRLAGHELLRHRAQDRERVLLETIGLSLLPAVAPGVPGLEIGVAVVSATHLARAGGDFYDVYDLGPGGVLLVVGDVSGKGLEALGIATQARYTIQAQIAAGREPARLLSQVNRVLCHILPRSRFVTAAVCLIDPAQKTLTVCLAGHPSPVVASSRGVELVETSHNGPLGVFQHLTFAETMRSLAPDETLILYTDGITEARSEDKLFGVKGLLETARATANRHPQEIADAVCRASLHFHDARLPADDKLALAVRLRR